LTKKNTRKFAKLKDKPENGGAWDDGVGKKKKKAAKNAAKNVETIGDDQGREKNPKESQKIRDAK